MRISSRVALWIVLFVSLALLSAVTAMASNKTPARHAKTVSAVCPVMGNAVPDISKASGKSVYKGKTYYFCCPACKPMFDANPAKYVKVKKPTMSVNCKTCPGVPQGACKGGVCPLPKSGKNATGSKNISTKGKLVHKNKTNK